MQEYLSLVDTERGGERTAVAFFGVVLFLMSLMLIVLGKYAEQRGPVRRRRSTRSAWRIAASKYQLAPSLIFYAVATALGLVQPYVGARTVRAASVCTSSFRPVPGRPLVPPRPAGAATN